MKLAINGESWGLYVNAQQFNREFLVENYPSAKGSRWKVQGSPMGGGGLEYLGETIEDYRSRYSLKSDDGEGAWKALIKLCKTLNATPLEQLEEALAPMLDVDETLWFLALDNALINSDGYWVRASDYCIFRDEKGIFHMIPHDMNEAFQPPMGPGAGGPGMGGRAGRRDERVADNPGEGLRGIDRNRVDQAGQRPRGSGIELDPLIGLNDKSKPLRSRLLAVPHLKQKYLEHVRTIAMESLDWGNLQPIVSEYQALISKEVEADTRKLSSYKDFLHTVSSESTTESERHMSLKQFSDLRTKYLLNVPAIKELKKR